MAKIAVDFVYHTSIPGWPSAQITAELRGSLDADGRFSNQWTSIPMERVNGSDDCYVFKGTAQLDSAEAGRTSSGESLSRRAVAKHGQSRRR
jgi:1,4-alpha-glucan branching enzyme